MRPYSLSYSIDHGLNHRVLGASKGGQPLDIAMCAQLALQCARDSNDLGAFGQLDIRNYHDTISRSEMWRSLRRRSIPVHWCKAAVRLQRCPQVRLRVRGSLTQVLSRTRGALTGNSLAPWFGMVVVEDLFSLAGDLIEPHNFKFMNVTLKPMAWSDNVFVFSNSVDGVAAALTIL